MTDEEFDEIWRVLRKFRDAAHEAIIYSQWQQRIGKRAKSAEEKGRLDYLTDIRNTVDETLALLGKDYADKPKRVGEIAIDEIRQHLRKANVTL